MTDRQLELVPDIVAHCMFVSGCGHTVRGTDPNDVHDAMERHYHDRHRQAIEGITGTPHHTN